MCTGLDILWLLNMHLKTHLNVSLELCASPSPCARAGDVRMLIAA